MPFLEQLTHPDNLYWAWEKAKKQYWRDSLWYDEIELSSFEANLESELKSISNDFINSSYNISPLRPLPYPKKKKDQEHEVRQMFWVSVRDQIAWIALINIIGPMLDSIMPTWSYGNRLYRPVWIEEENGFKRKRIGWYRHTSGYIYRKFQHSWPLFRRHLFFTIRTMSGQRGIMEPLDQEAYELERELPNNLQLPYLRTGFWPKQFKRLFWASIDFAKFYPTLKIEKISDNIQRHLRGFDNEMSEIISIANSLLKFPLDLSKWKEEDLKDMYIKDEAFFSGLPTGLFVAHFLANIAMLSIDEKINQFILRKRNVAHFRYVDDHVFITPSFKSLTQWIRNYEKILKEENFGINIQSNKIAPEEFKNYYENSKNEELGKKAKQKSLLDPKFPSPFMTETIAQISNIARTDFEILDENEQERFLSELEHLLLAKFDENEIREDTRMSFAATRISKLAPKVILKKDLVAYLNAEIKELKRSIAKGNESCQQKIETLTTLEAQLKEFESEERSYAEPKRILSLLLKATHEYPDKLRLWQRTLDYCKLSGITDFRELKDEVVRFYKSKPLSCAYLCAFLKQVMSQHIIDCAKIIINKDYLNHRRRNAALYTKALLNLYRDMKGYSSKPRKKFEILADYLFRCAIGTADLILLKEKEIVEKEFQVYIKEILRSFQSIKVARINWDNPSLEWLKNKYHSFSAWAWWAENRTTALIDTKPGHVWKKVSDKLHPDDIISWSMWARYPNYLTPRIIRKMLSNKAIAPMYFKEENFGWLYDVFNSKRIKKNKLARASIQEIIPQIAKKHNLVTLYEWVNWANIRETEKAGIYDPRLSEWFNLLIIEKCIKQLYSIDSLLKSKSLFPSLLNLEDKVKFIHPCNFFIPDYRARQQRRISWWDWKKRLEAKTTRFIFQPIMQDQRIIPEWLPTKGITSTLSIVQGVALLLLGLLRRSYEWPNIWNPIGLHKAYGNLIRELISEVSCSSYTSSILHACLLSRPRETLYFQTNLFTQPKILEEKDTLTDLPEINSVNVMLNYLNRAREILQEYQLSVRNNIPRQLIPINLERFKRNVDLEVVF
jgi:hypothetical protein